MKRFISLLLVLVMAFPMQGYASEPIEAEGISSYSMDYDKNIHIESAEDFVSVNWSRVGAGVTVYLDYSVDLSSYKYTQSDNGLFRGVFDGQGHTVSGLASDTPLFKRVNKGAEVKNLVIRDSEFTQAVIAGNNSGVIDCCSIIDTEVSGTGIIGGFASQNMEGGVIKNCAFRGTLLEQSGVHSKGAMASLNFGEIYNSYSLGGNLYKENNGTVLNCYSSDELMPSQDMHELLLELNANRQRDWCFWRINPVVEDDEFEGDDEFEEDKEFTSPYPQLVNELHLWDCDVVLSQDSFVYDGKQHIPDVTVRYNGATLVEGYDYYLSNLSWSHQQAEAGTWCIDINSSGNSRVVGNTYECYDITPLDLSSDNVDLSADEVSCLNASEFSVTITYNGEVIEGSLAIGRVWKDGVECGLDRPGVYSVEMCPEDDNFSGTRRIPVKVNKADILDAIEYGGSLNEVYFDYNGEECKPEISDFNDSSPLSSDYYWYEEGVDYTVEYKDNVDAGTAKMIVHGMGDCFYGDAELSYEIRPKDISKESYGYYIKGLSNVSYGYDGTPKTPEIMVCYDDWKELSPENYDISYEDNVNAGVAQVVVTGKGNYTGKLYSGFIIEPIDISGAEVSFSGKYDSSGFPVPDVRLGDKLLVPDVDYEVSYSDGEDGYAEVSVEGVGNYGRKIHGLRFPMLERKNISKANVTLSKTSCTYDGTAKTPSVTVKLDGKTLTLNTDYTVAYSNNINVGTAKAIITGKGNYTGSKSVNFTIVKETEQSDPKITCKKTVYKVAYGAKPFKINATSKSKMTFTSSSPKVAAVDKNTGKVTIKNTGVATITIQAGTATKKVTVKVSPKKPSVKSMNTAKGKKLTVKWARDKMASGYQVQISTDKRFKKNVKSKSLSKTSYTFTKLKTGKKYYVRVRSYKKSGRETLYSAWSKAKVSGKVKK